MMIVMERAEALARILAEEERMEKLMNMTAREAAEALALEGFDFTAEELIAFAEAVCEEEPAELDEENLDAVAGGAVKYLGPGWLWPKRPNFPRLPSIPLPLPLPLPRLPLWR